MKRGSKAILALILVLVAAGASSPFVFRTAALRWAKFSAHRRMRNLSPAEIQNLNTVPTLVILPDAAVDPNSVSTLDLGDYSLRVPTPESQSRGKRYLRLIYPRFEVLILMPFSHARIDDLARQMHFKDYFDMQSAMYRTRWADLDSQPDLESLKLFLLTISQKMSYVPCIEHFEGPRIRGFIIAPDERRTTLAEVFMRASHDGCGIHFSDRDGKMTIADVHQFLAVFDIQPLALQSAPHATTQPIR